MNNIPPADADDLRRLMSALADGEADAAECTRGCVAWAAAEGDVRETWYAYQLVGDVLRSDDLANRPARDRAFLERLRERLDAEPAVLAPQPLPAAPVAAAARRPRWLMPAALAAGVMALATVLVVNLGTGGEGAAGPMVAVAPASGVSPLAASAAAEAAVLAAATVPPGAIVRSAQLDRYLRAHRDYANTLPGSLPGGAGRSVTTVSLER